MIKIALAQINAFMGNINSNEKKILQYMAQANTKKAQMIIFPEMALSGYPPLDLIHKKYLLKKIHQSLKTIHKQVPENMTLLLGSASGGVPPGNSVFLLKKDQKPQIFSKEYLADYDVFDEKRYFKKGSLKDNFFTWKGFFLQILICEDTWQNPSFLTLPDKKEIETSSRLSPKLSLGKPSFLNSNLKSVIISLNASPFDINKHAQRMQVAKLWAKKQKSKFIYINAVGGQEDLIFDGGSFVLDESGNVLKQSPFFKEDLSFFVLPTQKKKVLKKNSSKQKKITEALTFGIKEFVEKNNFKTAHLGLSGGVDSALTAVLAKNALGQKKVKVFFLPGPFTSSLSEKCVQEFLKKFKLPLMVQTIEDYYFTFLKTLNPKTPLPHLDVTKQNLQARLRCLLLMAYANKDPESLLLGTSNKSELALGYGTLYGDLTGGLLPIGDLFKTEVYQLASYLKIPKSILNRKASAELKKNQKDEDDIPPYKILDPALFRLIEENQDAKTHFEKKIFQKILKSEFKRRQAPPILKIKNRSFGKGWRIPLSLSL